MWNLRALTHLSPAWSRLGVLFYLQVCDYLTTMAALKIGLVESSPFIRMLMHGSVAWGLAESKLLALAIGGVCFYLKRNGLLVWVNRWYGALVLWNLSLLVIARPVC